MSIEQHLADFYENGRDHYPALTDEEIAAVQLGTMIAVGNLRPELSVLVIQFPRILDDLLDIPAKLLGTPSALNSLDAHRAQGNSRDWLRIGMAGVITMYVQQEIDRAARMN